MDKQFSKTYYVKLDRDGLSRETTSRDNKAIAIRYDNFNNVWCKQHNCKLSKCREFH